PGREGALMAHANARLTQFGRLLLVQRITELGWPQPRRRRAWGCRGPPPTNRLPFTRATAVVGWPIGARAPTAAPRPSPAPRSVGCWPPAGVAARAPSPRLPP